MTIFTKHSILDIWQGSKYAFSLLMLLCCGSKRNTQEGCYVPDSLSKLKIFPYSEVIHGNTKFKLTKDFQRLKQNDIILNLMFLFSLSFSLFQCLSNKSYKQKWEMLFFTCTKLLAHVLACVHAITCNRFTFQLNQSC